jgi:hypothetical protein
MPLPVESFKTTYEQLEALRHYAYAAGLPVSEVIRRAVDEYLAAHPAPAAPPSATVRRMKFNHQST